MFRSSIGLVTFLNQKLTAILSPSVRSGTDWTSWCQYAGKYSTSPGLSTARTGDVCTDRCNSKVKWRQGSRRIWDESLFKEWYDAVTCLFLLPCAEQSIYHSQHVHLYLSVQRVCNKIGAINIHTGSEHYIVVRHSRGVTSEYSWEFIAQGTLWSAHIVQVGQVLGREENQLQGREGKRVEGKGREERSVGWKGWERGERVVREEKRWEESGKEGMRGGMEGSSREVRDERGSEGKIMGRVGKRGEGKEESAAE